MNNQKHNTMTILGIAFLLAISLRGLRFGSARFQLGDPLLFNAMNATTLAAIVIGAVVFILMVRHRAVVRFTDESWTRLRRVFWPDKRNCTFDHYCYICHIIYPFMLGYTITFGLRSQSILFTAKQTKGFSCRKMVCRSYAIWI